ncbi:sugar-binding domain-containing protein [Inconstantimicrobium mannanitabidum]|uniref:Uncharacterized protein n=1 Tax=Inconstantimicrobium mannanitabidum TaxID=1604901 RepID=A0ACB5RB80_9CLOT|nr:sugar-binding domain-containing protein [Clostridium sp. TW13]GKX66468.1 hypothetical protein rsdtw13_17260 [Clostridium sp. TW13]
MYKTIDLSGIWNFQLDGDKKGAEMPFNDTITLPGTTSYYKKGVKNVNVEIGCLTDEYKFEGYAWFSKTIELSDEVSGKNCFLYLERTRVTTIWIDGKKVGTQNSLCTPHVYDVTNYLSSGKHIITILVDNTCYPTKGGHLTSPDTQTNWNGITGRIELQMFEQAYLKDTEIYTNIKDKSVIIRSKIVGAESGVIAVSATSFNSKIEHKAEEQLFTFNSKEISITYSLGENALLWSEYSPSLYKLNLKLMNNDVVIDTSEVTFGLREFKAAGDKFTINGVKTFLRGKHDGLIFPRTGFAPTTVEEWLKVLRTSKSYGINHYRFHTCCPPEAAFIAADMLGIYMQPELPFWGTITDESYENHNQVEQDFLVSEGFSMLKSFGNHPSFTMMSLGNELWGSKERLDEILKGYKQFDNRHLYTEGSNNFQFCPVILENDDFLSGVRLAKNRLYRGSYAMCDAPLGHVQTAEPNTMKDYDEDICPTSLDNENNSASKEDNTIEIQFGTTAKKVEATEYDENMIPNVPVVSHEIGQYETYPDFNEIEKYTGPLKTKNFEVFKQRLEDKGLGDLADKYFKCSGKLAVACYKEELETAFRTKKLAGFQLLDLQDFSGQGTALVGMLDAFMESKGLISPEEWRSFCSDSVLMARFDKFNYVAEENFNAHVELTYYKNIPLNSFKLLWELKSQTSIYVNGEIAAYSLNENYISIGDISVKMPKVNETEKLTLALRVENTDIEKTYELWVYPNGVTIDKTGLNIFHSLSQTALTLLEKGENVVIIPQLDKLKQSIEGFYCADFWCYPMFRTISESMNREIPVGTMGLLINNTHPIFKYFPCEEYSTYQWWNVVSNSRSIIMDDTSKELRPIVQTIDNFERNHKLGLIFEGKVSNGNLLVCACDFEKIIEKPEAKQLLFSILNYVRSDKFKPQTEISITELKAILPN